MATGGMAAAGGGGAAAGSSGWQTHLTSWTQADLAVASPDLRRAYALTVVGGILQVTLYDGCRPDTSIDARQNDISYLSAQPAAAIRTKGRAAGQASPGRSTNRPIAAAFAPLAGSDDAEYLLVLLSSGQLLSLDALRLGIEAVLGVFPGVSHAPGAGLPLAVIAEHAWAVVAEGNHLGLTPVEVTSPESTAQLGGARPKPTDLPKGCVATVVLAYPGSDALLLVGCANGRLLLYHGSIGYKRQVSAMTLSLVQSLDTSSGSPSSNRGLLSYFRGARTPTAAIEFSIADAFVLGGGEDGPPGLLAAGGGGIGRNEGGGALVVWQVALEAWRDQASSGKKVSGTPCRMLAKGRCPTPVLRVLLLAPGRMGSMTPPMLSLDRNGDISIWIMHQDQLVVVSIVPGHAAVDELASRTFCPTGSVYLLIGLKSVSGGRVGWLDGSSLLAGSSSDVHLTPPLSCRTTSVLGPPIPASARTATGSLDVSAGGEVFFVSESRIRNYRAATGRTVEIQVTAPPGGSDWRALAVLDVFSPTPSAAATHLLVAVAMLSGGIENRAVWCMSTDGAITRLVSGGFDAAFLGRARIEDMKVVALTGNERDRTVSAQLGAAMGAAVSAPPISAAVPGAQRVLSGPPCGGQLLLYWGSGFSRGPLRASLNVPPDGSGLGLATGPLVDLPMSGPAELVAASWDNIRAEGPWCLALAGTHALWVIRFRSDAASGRSRAPPADLVAWFDLRTALLCAGRATSLAWLRPPPSTEGMPPGVVLVSTLWGVLYWSVVPGEKPRPLVLCERPQLLAGALLDRLLCVEVQSGISIFAGADRVEVPGTGPPWGPKARVRARPVSFMEAATAAIQPSSPQASSEAIAAVRDSDWRLVPAVLPRGLPEETLRGLWPIASTSDAPPQLCQSAPAFHRTATAAGDEFRALAAIISGLQSGGGLSAAAARRARGGGSGAAEEARAAGQVEEAVLRDRSDPARAEFLRCASSFLLNCSAQAGARGGREEVSMTSLALASRGLAKHDLLPFANLLATVLRGMRDDARDGPGWHHLVLPAGGEDLSLVPDASKGNFSQHWTHALRTSAPLAAALLSRSQAQAAARTRAGMSEEDFSASALLHQRFSEPPAVRRPSQVVQPTGQNVCQLHTATLMQWLGLGSTQVQVRVLHAILQEGEAVGTGESTAGPGASSLSAKGPPAILANGLLAYWRCADGEGSSVRDSGGCCRVGRLSGVSEWRGPLPSDEPLETVDEWGSNLAPNFGISFGASGELTYMPAEGAAGSEDRQMLSLIGGARADGAGQKHLRSAVAVSGSLGDDASDTEESLQPGWTVEFWARLSSDVRSEILLFGRGAGPGHNTNQHSLAWTYSPMTSNFDVRASGRSLVSGPAGGAGLVANDWVHLALRSNLASLEVWAGTSVVLKSAGGVTLERSAPVPATAGLRFGAQGLEVTEMRVWGVFRSDSQLVEQQRQPLPTVLSDERKQLKVRIRRAASAEPSGPDLAAGGLFGLTRLEAPASRHNRRRNQESSAAPRNDSAFDFGPAQDEASKDHDSSGGDPWGSFAAPAQAWSTGPPASAWPAFEESTFEAPVVTAAGTRAAEEAVLSTDEDASSVLSSRVTHSRSAASSRVAAPVSSYTEKCHSCGAVLLASHQFCRRCGARRQAPTLPDSTDEDSVAASIHASTPSTPAMPSSREVEALTPEKQVALRAPALEEVLPEPMSNERSMVHEADSKLFAAVHALEHQSYVLASMNFRSVIQVIGRQMHRRHGGGPPDLSVATRARLEACSAYVTLCTLLNRCEDLRQAVAAAGKDGHSLGHMASGHYGLAKPEMLRRLCDCWACVLRIAKAPQHTVRFAVQGMAIFFTLARAVGGWSAAHQVASALVSRCREMLTEAELNQVEYVCQTTSVGRVAHGASSDAACSCPSCGRPLDPLAPTCGYCFAEVVVCFRDQRLCDGRHALFCDVCSAAVSERKELVSRRDAGGLARHPCLSCGIGELQPRGLRSRSEVLAF